MITLAAEYPNDNPRLHLGARWMPTSTTGPASAKLPPLPVAIASPPPEVTPEEIPPPRESAVVPSTVAREPVASLAELAAAVFDGASAEDEPVLVEELEPIEAEVSVEGDVVSALPPAPEVEVAHLEAPAEIAPSAPFAAFCSALVDVALAAGSPAAAAIVPALLDGRVPDALADDARALLSAGGILEGDAIGAGFASRRDAWRAILLGTSDDFDACGGAMLDEFAADLVARAMGSLAHVPSLKRELRTRGVAAFGLLDVAA